MIETYTHERAGFAERAAALAGRTTYREPQGAAGTRVAAVPDEHAIAAAFAFARMGENDVGPDIAVSIATGTLAHQQKVVTELAAALLSGLRGQAKHSRYMLRVAMDSFLRVVTGRGCGKPEGMPDREYQIAAALGDRVLFAAADEAFLRAAMKYHHHGRTNTKKPLDNAE